VQSKCDVTVDGAGRYLVALGRSWHPEEFTCMQCKALLDEGGFFEERGAVYCTKCHDNRYAPNCAKCKKMITGVGIQSVVEIMHALKMTYHVQCFKCAACKNPIRNQAFYMEEGEPYCERGGKTLYFILYSTPRLDGPYNLTNHTVISFWANAVNTVGCGGVGDNMCFCFGRDNAIKTERVPTRACSGTGHYFARWG
uniref:PDZ and LIM domain 7 n=1 Tax=Neogobius melanostomus TaxID=47308 RepID=A0A8C6TH65_9GOBI